MRKRTSFHKFRDVVGLSIGRKRRKLDCGLDLVARFGTRKAATEWLRIYTKKGSRWVERDEHLKTELGP
jgi:hypothetical protein